MYIYIYIDIQYKTAIQGLHSQRLHSQIVLLFTGLVSLFFAQHSQLISGDKRHLLPGPLRFVFLDALDHVMKYLARMSFRVSIKTP